MQLYRENIILHFCELPQYRQFSHQVFHLERVLLIDINHFDRVDFLRTPVARLDHFAIAATA